MCPLFIKLFHINIFVLNRPIHIYKIDASRNLICPSGPLLQTRARMVMLMMVLTDVWTSSSPLPDLNFPNVLGRNPWLVRLHARDWGHPSFIL